MRDRWTYRQIQQRTGRQATMHKWKTARQEGGRITIAVIEVIERGWLDLPPHFGPWVPSWSFATATQPLQCVKGCRIWTDTQYVIGLGFDPHKRQSGPLCDRCYRLRIRSMDCHYCGAPGGEVEHVEPPKRGGGDIPSNLVPACTRCNTWKRHRGWAEFENMVHARRQLLARTRLELGLSVDVDALYYQPRLF